MDWNHSNDRSRSGLIFERKIKNKKLEVYRCERNGKTTYLIMFLDVSYRRHDVLESITVNRKESISPMLHVYGVFGVDL